jgi:glycosyltransferase involved in cell wall biosynthesis
MKILFLTKYYPPSEGGIERYGHMLCSDLLALGIEVEVVAVSEDKESEGEEWIDGVKVYRLLPQLNFNSTPITFDLPRLLKEKADGFDLLHLNFPYPWTDLLYLASWSHRKTVMTYHSDIFRRKWSLSGMLLRAYHPVIHKVLARVSAIIASSPNCIENSPFLKRRSGKCRVIPMPVDVTDLDAVDSAAVAEESALFGRFVLFVGRLVYYKGVRYLIEALAQVPEARLVIVGRGPLEAELKQLAAELGLEDRIFFLGKITDDRLRAIYHACRCFVLPSVSHAEGFGIVLAEAMACRKPVISTQLQTGTSYVNLDGVSGYVVPPQNPAALAKKIDILMRDEALYKKLGEQARHRAITHFDRSIVVRETLNLYEEVLAEGAD